MPKSSGSQDFGAELLNENRSSIKMSHLASTNTINRFTLARDFRKSVTFKEIKEEEKAASSHSSAKSVGASSRHDNSIRTETLSAWEVITGQSADPFSQRQEPSANKVYDQIVKFTANPYREKEALALELETYSSVGSATSRQDLRGMVQELGRHETAKVFKQSLPGDLPGVAHEADG